MNIDARDANVLKYFKKHDDVLLSEITFDSADLYNLVNNGLLKTKDITVHQGEGLFPLTKTAYSITNRGKALLKIYNRQKIIASITLSATLIAAITGIIQLCR